MLRPGELQRSRLEGAGPLAGWIAAGIAAPLALGRIQAGAGLGPGCRMLHAGYSTCPALHPEPQASPY